MTHRGLRTFLVNAYDFPTPSRTPRYLMPLPSLFPLFTGETTTTVTPFSGEYRACSSC